MRLLKAAGMALFILWSNMTLAAGVCNFQSGNYKVSMQVQDYTVGQTFEVRDPGRYPCVINNSQGPVTTIVCRNNNEPDNFTLFGGTCFGAEFTAWTRVNATLYRCQQIEVAANNLSTNTTSEAPTPATTRDTVSSAHNVTSPENSSCEISIGIGSEFLSTNFIEAGASVPAGENCILVNDHLLICKFLGSSNNGVTADVCRGTKFVASGSGYQCQQELL